MEIKVAGWTINGCSTGGIRTVISIKELDICFDIGVITNNAVKRNNLLISHAHADHLSALQSYLSIRYLWNMRSARIFVPVEIFNPINEIISIWEKLQGHRFNYEIIGVKEGEIYVLKKEFYIKPFKSIHSIPTTGYTIFQRKNKLKKIFLHLPSQEIIRMKKRGEDIFDIVDEPIVSYTSDTLIDVIEKEEFIKKSKLLIIETTYIDDQRDEERAQIGQHIHLRELVERLGVLDNEGIVLFHFSQIYKPYEIEEKVRKIVPEKYRGRFYFLLDKNFTEEE